LDPELLRLLAYPLPGGSRRLCRGTRFHTHPAFILAAGSGHRKQLQADDSSGLAANLEGLFAIRCGT
jgi:hypothetical protein